jgi:tetratricopeptide (TPR) repeat protein
MKISLILILLLFPSYCFSVENSKENSCGPTTFYADLKGDATKETVVLVNGKHNTQERGCHFESLTIYEKNKVVYEEKSKISNAGDSTYEYKRDITIVRFRKGSKEMIFYRQHYCSNCDAGTILGFIKGKYQTVTYKASRGVQVVDLEGNGNKEIVADPHGYYGTMPRIYDYDLINDEFVSSEKNHPKFYQDLIQECEDNLARFQEKGAQCCSRTVNLEMIASAATTLEDDDLYEKTMDRLSAVHVEIGKFFYSKNRFDNAIKEYQTAIEKNNRNYEAFNFLGYSFFRNHKFKDAVNSLVNSIAINPSYVEGHYNLALAYWADGEQPKAIHEIKTLLQLDPKYKEKIKDDTQFKKFKSNKEFQTLMGIN